MSVLRPTTSISGIILLVTGWAWIVIISSSAVICWATPASGGAIILTAGDDEGNSRSKNDNSAISQSRKIKEEDGSNLSKEDFSQDALERLSRLFGISKIPENFHHRTPPDYMLELYSTVAYDDGITKQSVPYDADVVRAIPDKALHQQILYHFNVSYIDPSDAILQAEFHLYKVSPKQPASREEGASQRHAHLLQLRLYQILDPDRIEDKASQRLLHQRRVSAYDRGWEVFRVKDTVEQWVGQGQANYGFLIETSSINGDAEELLIKFAQKSEHHDSKQPLLVVFTEEMKAQMEEEQGILEDEEPPVLTPVDKDDIVAEEEVLVVDQIKTEIQPDIVPAKPPNEGHPEISIKLDLSDIDGGQGASPSVTNQSLATDISGLRRKYIDFLNEKHRAEHGAFPNIQTFSFMSPEEHRELVSGRQLSRVEAEEEHSPGESSQRKKKRRRRRKRRAEDYNGGGNRNNHHRKRKKVCSLHELYVDFDKIGWSGWIISPKGYDAFHCKGSCPFPLGQNQQPTNHATVQSIVHALGAGKDVGTPCCVPNKLFSISLLYFDDQENVILKQYDDMVATSCGCH